MPKDEDDLDEAVRATRRQFVAAKTDWIGECREEVPYRDQFYVRSGGKQYISCMHTPPHTYPA